MLLQHSFRTVCIFHGRLKIPERRCKHIFISHKPLLCLSSWWLQFFRAIALVYVWRCLHKLCKTQRNWIYKSPEDGRGRCPCICLSYNNIHFKTSALTLKTQSCVTPSITIGLAAQAGSSLNSASVYQNPLDFPSHSLCARKPHA